MACFWQGLLGALTQPMLKETFNCNSRPRPDQLISLFHQKVTKTPNVLWQGQKLKEQEMEENIKRIKEFKPHQARSGYDCSSCDPYLLLVCQLFKVNINHKFNGTMIKYTYQPESQMTLSFASNRGHFWKGK